MTYKNNTKKYLLVVSTAKITDGISNTLKILAKGQLDISLHIGRQHAHFRSTSFSRVNAYNGKDGHIMKNRSYSGRAESLFRSDEYLYYRDLFVDHIMRRQDSYNHRAHDLVFPQDFYDYFHVVCDAIADEVIKRKINYCLFFNIPHLGYDTAAYCVAKILRIPILILSQSSLLPDHIFSLTDPLLMGSCPIDTTAPSWTIDPQKKFDLHYMDNIKQKQEFRGKITYKALLNLILFVCYKQRWRAINPFYWYTLIKNVNRVYGYFPKWRDPFARFFHTNEIAYFDYLYQFENTTIDLKNEFVYFPLQLQPEMTTSALGERYRDQAYAIECLSRILPADVWILVKENPKQGAFMRGPMFFHRLKQIPNVKLLPCWANTHDLIHHANIVATVTGTAGLEAICCGKPVIVFGKPWYLSLPGIYPYSPTLCYYNIVNKSINHQILEQALGSLFKRAHSGSIDRHYARTIKDFDIEKNNQIVASTILSLLNQEIEPTFLPTNTD